MSRHRTDVCIVGDGPAALLLQTMLIEHGVSSLRLRDGRRPPGHWQHPHRLGPAVQSLFAQPPIAARWNGSLTADGLTSGQAVVDALRSARPSGSGQVLDVPGTTQPRLERIRSGWRMQAGTAAIHARTIIDATGTRRAVLRQVSQAAAPVVVEEVSAPCLSLKAVLSGPDVVRLPGTARGPGGDVLYCRQDAAGGATVVVQALGPQTLERYREHGFRAVLAALLRTAGQEAELCLELQGRVIHYIQDRLSCVLMPDGEQGWLCIGDSLVTTLPAFGDGLDNLVRQCRVLVAGLAGSGWQAGVRDLGALARQQFDAAVIGYALRSGCGNRPGPDDV